MIGLCLVAACVGIALIVFGIWLSGLSEQRRLAMLIANAQPPRRVKTQEWEVATKPDGIRNRVKRFKSTLAGVGRLG